MANSLKQYEKKYSALQDVVKTLDSEELPIHEVLTHYKKGMTLIKECSDILNRVEEEVQQIVEEIEIKGV